MGVLGDDPDAGVTGRGEVARPHVGVHSYLTPDTRPPGGPTWSLVLVVCLSKRGVEGFLLPGPSSCPPTSVQVTVYTRVSIPSAPLRTE